MRASTLFLVGCAFGSAVACGRGGGDKITGSACDDDHPCAEGACYEASCYATCEHQVDCAEGEICLRKPDAEGDVSICAPIADEILAEACTSDAECAAVLPFPAPCTRPACDGTCTLASEPDGVACNVTTGVAGTCSDGRCRCGATCGTPLHLAGGVFQMGCDAATETGCGADEGPVHPVTLASFRIDRTEVTVGAWRACVNAQGCVDPAVGGACTWEADRSAELPVACVSWAQARRYCLWVGGRLCSEAEWEYAARGPDGRPFPWGDATPTCERATFDPTGSPEHPTGDGCNTGAARDVGSAPDGATPEGVLDLAGNVWEWVADEYQAGYDDAPDDGSAWAPSESSPEVVRVVRGGGYADPASALRAANRMSNPAGRADVAVGFRCCRDL